MLDRHLGLGFQVHLAADIGGNDAVWIVHCQGLELVVQQALAEFGLEDRVGAGGATTQMFFLGFRQFNSRFTQYLVHHATLLHGMLQGAGAMECHLAGSLGHREFFQVLLEQEGAQVDGHIADFLRLGGVMGVVFQQMAVLLDHCATAGRGHDDGLGARFNGWPPGVDVAAHGVECLIML